MDFQEKQIKPPKSWEQFEELCLVLFRAIWQDPMTQKNGRLGQMQHGVDIFGSPERAGGSFYGIQCKGKDAGYGSVLTIAEFDKEVTKANLFIPKLTDFIVTTAAPRDAHLQKHVREVSAVHTQRGLFPVHLLSWEDIQSLLAEHPKIIERFYPEHAFDLPELLKTMQSLPTSEEIGEILAHLRQHAIANYPLLANRTSPWRPIIFEVGRDLGPALLGRALGPSDATACPRLHEADVVVRQLQQAFSARLVGVPGSGKSVTAYQAINALVLQGWLAVRLSNPHVDCVSLKSPYDKPTLFLVDDAHLMDQDVLRDLEDQACPTRLLLSVQMAVDSTATYRGAIFMDGARAVQTIASGLKSRLSDTLAAVQRADDHVGERWLDEDLEQRIEVAQASSRFPWQFCFILGGGWRRANEAADASRSRGADLILAIAAAQQLASRDAETANVTMLQLGLLAGLTVDEIQQGLTWLVQERLLISESDLRCPHQKFSVAIIGKIYSGMNASKRAAFTSVCRSILLDEATTLAGAKSLLSEFCFLGFQIPWVYELESLKWIDEETLHVLLVKCWGAYSAEDRMFASLTIAELGRRFSWHDLIPKVQINYLGEWFSEAVHPMGFGLAGLLNSIYNDDKLFAAQIVSAANPKAVAKLASSVDVSTAYAIGEMIDRMAIAGDKEWKESVRLAFDRSQILKTVAQWPDGGHIAVISNYCWSLSLYDTELAFDVLQAAMPVLQRALAAEPMNEFHEIDDIVGHLLRVWDPLGVYTGKLSPSSRQVALARELCKLIDCKKAAGKISSASLRDMQRAAFFLGFFRRVEPKKFVTLCRELDWSRLDETIGTEWGHLDHSSTMFICQAALDEKSRGTVVTVIQKHLEDIRVMPSRIAVLAPDLACAVVDRGGSIAIGEDMALSWLIPAFIVQKIGELRPDLVPVLVAPHELKAATSLQSMQSNIFDDVDIFLQTLDKVAPDSVARILGKVDANVAEDAWAACITKGGKPRRTAAYLIGYCLTMPSELGKVAQRLRQRFPKTSAPRPEKSSTGK